MTPSIVEIGPICCTAWFDETLFIGGGAGNAPVLSNPVVCTNVRLIHLHLSFEANESFLGKIVKSIPIAKILTSSLKYSETIVNTRGDLRC